MLISGSKSYDYLNEIPLHTHLDNCYLKKSSKYQVSVRMWRTWNLYALCWECNCVTAMKNNMLVTQELKNKITTWSCNFTSRCIPKKLKAGSWRNIYTHMTIAAIFTIDKSWKQLRCLIDEWINTIYFIGKVK